MIQRDLIATIRETMIGEHGLTYKQVDQLASKIANELVNNYPDQEIVITNGKTFVSYTKTEEITF